MDQKDLDQIAILIDTKLDSKIGKLEENLEGKMFKWKSDIIDVVDSLAKEIRDEREFRDISGHQTADNARRIGKLEQKVFGVVES